MSVSVDRCLPALCFLAVTMRNHFQPQLPFLVFPLRPLMCSHAHDTHEMEKNKAWTHFMGIWTLVEVLLCVLFGITALLHSLRWFYSHHLLQVMVFSLFNSLVSHYVRLRPKKASAPHVLLQNLVIWSGFGHIEKVFIDCLCRFWGDI